MRKSLKLIINFRLIGVYCRQVVISVLFLVFLYPQAIFADDSTLAPKSLYAINGAREDVFENLDNVVVDSLPLKLLLSALEKMDKKDSVIYGKIISAAENKMKTEGKKVVLDFSPDTQQFWDLLKNTEGEKRTNLLQILSEQHFVKTITQMKALGIDVHNTDYRELILEILLLYIPLEASSLVQYFDLIGFNSDDDKDRREVVKIIKECIKKNHAMSVLMHFDKFGLNSLKPLHRANILDIAEFCAEMNPSATAFHFENFGISAARITERDAVISIARKCAAEEVTNTINNFKSFGLDGRVFKDKKPVIEIARICAANNTVPTVENFSVFGLDAQDEFDRKAIADILNICAKGDLGRTLKHLDQFGFDMKNSADREIILAIAAKLSESQGRAVAENFHLFGLNPRKAGDYAVIVNLAKKCAASDGAGTSEYFKKFGLDGGLARDKAVVIEIAKICVNSSPLGVARHFDNFNLDGHLATDREAVLEIAMLSAVKNGRETSEYFKKFKLAADLDNNQDSIIEIAKTCAMHYGHDTDLYIKNFGLDLNIEGLNAAVLRYLLKGQDIPWDDDKLSALRNYLQRGLLDSKKIDLKNLYILLRTDNFIKPDELDYIKHTQPASEDNHMAEANMALLERENRLIEYNNNAIKFLGAKHLNKEIALRAIGETKKMLDSYSSMFQESDDLELIAAKINAIEAAVLADTAKLTDENKRLLRDIAGDLSTLQDIIVYLHQHSIRKMFEKFSADKSRAGNEVNFKIGVASVKAVDILKLQKKDLFYSSVKFLQDFYYKRLKVVLGMNTIVAGKKLYHFFRLGVHTAKLAIDLHSPLTGGNILFEYNENEFDSMNKGHMSDVCGNDIRQFVLEEVLKRSGMEVAREGLNLHAVYGKETGALSVEDLTQMYDKIYYVMHILSYKTFTIGEDVYNLSDTAMGMEYRKRKTPDLYPDMKLIRKMVQENANIIEKIIDFHRAEYHELLQYEIEYKGYGQHGLNTMEYLEQYYRKVKAKKPPLEDMSKVCEDPKIFAESKKIGAGIDSIRDLFVWDNEAVVGRYRLIKTDVEIGYKDKDILYGVQDSRTGKIILGWLERGVTSEVVFDYDEFLRRLKNEGMYPVSEDDPEYDFSLPDFLKGMKQEVSAPKEETKASGLSVSPGIADGEVIFYKRGVHNAADLSNKIVVVDSLTPEDDTVMLEAAGLVILKGGPLSHGAIFAREMNIPAMILNSFNINGGQLKGYLSTRETGRQETLNLALGNVKVSFMELKEKEWNISEGDIISLDGDTGKLGHVSANKQYILKEFENPAPDIEEIIAVARKDKLGQWLYDMAYFKKQLSVIKVLEKNNPAFKNYGEILRKKELSMRHQRIESLIATMDAADTKWQIYSILTKLNKSLNTLTAAERDQYEFRLTQILNNKDILKEEEKQQQDSPFEAKDYYDLDEVGESLAGVLGNKVAKLGGDTISVVNETGGRVPSGIGINSSLSRLLYEINYEGQPVKDLIKQILKAKGSPLEKSKKIASLLNSPQILKSTAYAELIQRLNAIYADKWDGKDVAIAVRSSAVRARKQLEDTLGTAGLYKSLMFIGKNDFAESVVDVWKSLYSEEAISNYFNVMQEKNIDALVDELAMGVVGQEMVDSDVSIVAFSANPASGADEIIITAGYGQGEGVVSGTVPVDTFIVNAKTGEIVRRNIVKKNEMMIRQENSRELKKVNVEEEAAAKTNILFVCADNTCQSVMSEYILKDLLQDKKDVNISSAGIYSGYLQKTKAEAITVLDEMGIDAGNHKTQTLTDEMIAEADLVIVMADYQKDEIVQLYNDAESKTMVISGFDEKREFEEILDPGGPAIEIYQELAEELKNIFKDGGEVYDKALSLKRKALTDKMNAAALNDDEITRIVEIVKALAEEYGNPQDVEMALQSSKINVVQRRMITSLGIDEGKSYLEKLFRKNLAETIRLKAQEIREKHRDISYLDFIFFIAGAVNRNETIINESLIIDLIDKEWHRFNYMNKVAAVRAKESKIVLQAA